MRPVIRYFKKSTQANAKLRLLRIVSKTGPGLVSIGDTRFVTHYFAGDALRRNLPHIEKQVREGAVVISVRGVLRYIESLLTITVEL